MLHIMDRDMDSSEDVELVGHNWRKIKNEAFVSMYILGRAKLKPIPMEYQSLIKGALQNMTNLQRGNILLEGFIRVFSRLYIHSQVFHSQEVCIFFVSFRVFQSL